MNTIDWKTYKFRCSNLQGLMTSSRNKFIERDLYAVIKEGKVDAKTAGLTPTGFQTAIDSKCYADYILSETTKTFLRDIYIGEVYGREKYDTINKYTQKGIACEPDAMDLVKKVTKQTYFKNSKQFENEFVTGTPDITVDVKGIIKWIKDVKCSYSIFSFRDSDEDYALSSYFYQMLGYMWLTGAPMAELFFCLVNTPEEMIQDEMYRMSFKKPEIGESDAAADKFRLNFIFDDIPAKDRLKSYKIAFDKEKVEELKKQILLSREYLATVTL